MKRSSQFERGMALMSAMLLLLVTTILAMAMFRSFGMSERISGNTREKSRALHAAATAQTYAESWLISQGAVNATLGQTCPTSGGPAASGAVVCTNALSNPTSLPWGGGFAYTPPNMTVGASAGTIGNYPTGPAFYVQYLGFQYLSGRGGNSSVYTYLIDAEGAGGNSASAAVVEGVYMVSVTGTNQSSNKKFVNLGLP